MRQTNGSRPALLQVRVVTLMIAAVAVVAACGNASRIKGEIGDDGITLDTDHAGPLVRLELHNDGSKPCDLVGALTSLPIDSLPVVDGRVIIDESGSGAVRAYTGGRIEPGAVLQVEFALEGTPRSDDRVLMCNGVGDYEQGRYAVLRFDR